MKTDRLQPDEQRPAKANANAGRKKPVPMTAEEIQLQRDRLLNVYDDEKENAMKDLAGFITKTMKKWGYTLQNGPFSYEEMQGDAVKVISYDCYCAVFYGKRRWPEHIDLKTVLAGIAWSKMDHIVRSYASRKDIKIISTDDEDRPKSLDKDVEEATEFSMEMTMRDLGFEIAINACRDHPLYQRYLQVLQDVHTYEDLKDELHMSYRKLFKLEAEVLAFLETL